MSENYSLFQSFTDPALAQDIAGKLKEANIPFQIEDTSPPIDPLIIGSGLDADIRIKLQPKDFQKAHAVLETYYSQQVDAVENDYYLFSFTDEELQDIITQPDQWGIFDYKLAQKILKERGKEVNEQQMAALKSKRIKEIAKPEQIEKSWIILGYLISIFFSPLGIFFGSAITSFKKTLPNGIKVYSYDERGRKHGQNILIISTVLTVFYTLLKLKIR